MKSIRQLSLAQGFADEDPIFASCSGGLGFRVWDLGFRVEGWRSEQSAFISSHTPCIVILLYTKP